MPETFVLLADRLRAPVAPVELPHAESAVDVAPEAPEMTPPASHEEALSEVRRFRAALADAAELMREWIARDIACDVLARELLLADADIAAIAARAVEGSMAYAPVALIVHPDDVERASACGIAVEAGDALRRGDALVRVACGTIDATLGARLEALLEALP